MNVGAQRVHVVGIEQHAEAVAELLSGHLREVR